MESHPLKAHEYIFNSNELAIDLKAANWIEGNSNLRHLNSLLTYSTKDIRNLPVDLNRTHKGYSLGLQIHGRPFGRFQTDPEEYADEGIIVNPELVLAMGYYAHINDPVKTKPEKTTILFAPLGKSP